MKLFLHENKDIGCCFSERAIFVFGKQFNNDFSVGYYFLFNSPIYYVKKYFDISNFEERMGVGYNRYLLKITENFKIIFKTVFFAKRRIEV